MKAAATKPKGKRVPLDEQVAYHEAGHAVAFYVFGDGVEWVRIYSPTAKERGGVKRRRKPPGLSDTKSRTMREVLATMAGRVAERLHYGRRRRLHWLSSDGRACEEYIERLTGRHAVHAVGLNLPPEMVRENREHARLCRAYEKLLEHRTERLLRACWPAVDAVARALLDERKLTGARVRQLIREAKPDLDIGALRAAATALLRSQSTERPDEADYLSLVPKAVPSGRIVVHNFVRHTGGTRRLGMRGFRAWTAAPAPHYVACDCGWAPHLGTHYRVDRAGA